VKSWFKAIEGSAEGAQFPVADVVRELTFDQDGLIPVIVQDAHSKQVLMFAWMNREALAETLATQTMCYFSRSRQQLWRKGESSGHVQRLCSLRTDCDGDVLLAEVEQAGAACHTYRTSCFYLKFEGEQVRVDSES
jgi:phosphoribosyl-AMP cyclohydrolase